MKRFEVTYRQGRTGYAGGKIFDGGSWTRSEEVEGKTKESALSRLKKKREHKTSSNEFWIEILNIREVN